MGCGGADGVGDEGGEVEKEGGVGGGWVGGGAGGGNCRVELIRLMVSGMGREVI